MKARGDRREEDCGFRPSFVEHHRGSVLAVRLQGLLKIKQDNGCTSIPRDRLKDKDRRKDREREGKTK